MEILQLKVEERDNFGKGPSKRIRLEGLVPGVIYGREMQPRHVLVSEHEISTLVRRTGEHSLVEVTIGSDKPELAIFADIQHHPVTDRILHIDFKTIKRGQAIEVPVDIEFVGEAVGAKEGGMFMANLYQLTIKAVPMKIPSSIVVDITELDLEHAMHVSDVVVGEDMEIMDDPDLTIASIVMPRIVIEEEVEEEEVPEEGAEEGAEEEKEDSAKKTESGEKG